MVDAATELVKAAGGVEITGEAASGDASSGLKGFDLDAGTCCG
jgi:hypothetical protein